ncbi:lasso peptide biosynthesis B2 protein [Brevundimonas pondensis]|uniref:lasso peptide biosynthesis B2 protein n=1 Tax=Brevundimonas pondensis TaxID=2774189 RepID=UPI00320B15C5
MPIEPEIDLAKGVHLAWIHEDIVVLDVQADAYSLLVGAANLIRPARQGEAVSADAAVLNDLALAGLTSTTRERSRRPPAPATHDARSTAPTSLNARTRALANALCGTMAFRQRPLPALVEAARLRSSAPHRRDLYGAIQEAEAFEAIRPWVPYEGDCLQRSWMLHRHLHQRGLDADWVFGVRTWPFLAHCWVQVGDTIVGDSLDRVGGFTPIMVA